MSYRSRRGGFSLVELLTVMAVVGIAVALTIPAIQRAREAARHVQCRNNLKQIGVAIHSYHEAFGRLPSGFIGVDAQGNPEVSGPTGWGWAAMLLPQLEENALFSGIDFGKPILDPANEALAHTQLSEFRCPSDTGAGEFLLMAADGETPLATLPTSNYVGNFGTGDLDYCNNLIGLGIPCTSGASLSSRGVFFHNSSVTLASMTDGTSNTLMVSERSSSGRSTLQRPATWVGVVPGAEDAYSLNLGSVSDIPSDPIGHDDGFSSDHPGVVDMLMADGRVESFSHTTSPDVLMAIASRNAGDTPNSTSGGGAPGWFASGMMGITVASGSDLSKLPAGVSLRAGVSQSGSGITPTEDGTAKRLGGDNLTYLPANAPGFPEWDEHFLFPFGDGTYASWHGANPDTVGPIIIKYDFRDFFGFPNRINEAQKGVVAAAAQMWSDATCGKVIFQRDATAPDEEIIIVGVGSLEVFGLFDGPSGVLGVGGFVGVSGRAVFSGFTWMDEEENWDTEIGNGNPPGTIDFFTVLGHEFGHALGLGHLDDLPGDNYMNSFYDGEETQLTVNDISVLELLYGTNCLSGPGRGGVPEGWERSDTSPPPEL